MMMMMMIISPFYGSPVSQRKMKVLCLSHSWWKCLGSASVPLLDWPFLLGRCRKEVSGWRTCWVSFILLHWKLEVSLGWFYSSSSARQNDPVHPELHISMSFLLSWSDVCVCVEHLSKFFLWFCKSFTGTVLEPDITVSSTEFTCISELNFSLSSPSVSTKASWSCSLFLFDTWEGMLHLTRATTGRVVWKLLLCSSLCPVGSTGIKEFCALRSIPHCFPQVLFPPKYSLRETGVRFLGVLHCCNICL